MQPFPTQFFSVLNLVFDASQILDALEDEGDNFYKQSNLNNPLTSSLDKKSYETLFESHLALLKFKISNLIQQVLLALLSARITECIKCNQILLDQDEENEDDSDDVAQSDDLSGEEDEEVDDEDDEDTDKNSESFDEKPAKKKSCLQ